MTGPGATRVETIVLLQGVNVGGRRTSMANLRDALSAAGCDDVRSHGQAGNLIAAVPVQDDLASWLGATLSAAAGFRIDVVTRSPAEITRIVDRNPYPGTPGDRLHVTFLSSAPTADPLEGIDLASVEPEHATVDGREVYLFLPNGMARSPLATLLAKRGTRHLGGGVSATSRNWNTVTALADLLGLTVTPRRRGRRR